jgi:actin-related protein 6
MNVGGKLLTNYLKELISYRVWNVMDETHLINGIKEKLCYVSQNYLVDLRATRDNKSNIRREYVLPNGSNRLHGYVKGEELKEQKVKSEKKSSHEDDAVEEDDEVHVSDNRSKRRKTESASAGDDDQQVLVMNNERISIPEALFNPSDLGLKYGGIAEMIVESISACHQLIQPVLYSNILLVGGNAMFPGFTQRLQQEIRQLAPEHYPVNVYTSKMPLYTSWKGAALLASQPDFHRYCVTIDEYQEYGESICQRKFFESSSWSKS